MSMKMPVYVNTCGLQGYVLVICETHGSQVLNILLVTSKASWNSEYFLVHDAEHFSFSVFALFLNQDFDMEFDMQFLPK